MNKDEIAQVVQAGKKFTYANPVVDHQLQKEVPNRIRITAGGNLIDYEHKVLAKSADINTAKLH